MNVSLEKYNGKNSRHRCPKCGDEHSLVRYINLDTGQYIAPHVGRCNHEVGCGYHYTPSQYFKAEGCEQLCTVQPTHTPTKYFSLIPKSYLKRYRSNESNFIKWLIKLFGVERVAKIAQQNEVGMVDNGKVVFWQMDKTGNSG